MARLIDEQDLLPAVSHFWVKTDKFKNDKGDEVTYNYFVVEFDNGDAVRLALKNADLKTAAYYALRDK